jgi:nicotinamidase-related amidase
VSTRVKALSFRCRHYVSAPPEREGLHTETLQVRSGGGALLLLNLYGLLLPKNHPARRAQARIYGERELERRERIVRQNLLPVMHAAREANMPVVYVADSVPNIGLEKSNIRQVMMRSLDIDPLTAFVEKCNDPLEYHPGSGERIVYAPELDPRENDYYVRKWVYSGFHATWLDRLLRNLGTTTLFCTGFNGDSDLFSTMLAGHWAGYRIVLVRGCHAAVDVPAYEPEIPLTERLEMYAEGSLGYTISTVDFIAACMSPSAPDNLGGSV